MIAKIISTLKLNRYNLLAITLPVALVILFYFISYEKSDPEILDCAGNLHINIAGSDADVMLEGNIHLVFHVVPGNLSYVHESGKVRYNGQDFTVNRSVRSFFQKEKQNGYYKVTREGIDKNPSDNIPDSLANELASAQKVLFIKIENIDKNIWRISDLRRTLFVCKRN